MNTKPDPLEGVLLPIDVFIGTMRFAEGSTVRAFVQEMQQWRLRAQQEEIAAYAFRHVQITETMPKKSNLSAHALRQAGLSGYHEGMPCEPPPYLDFAERREWASGWIDGLKTVWRVG